MGEPAGILEIARRYLQALERGETGAALRGFTAPEVVLEEFPNLLTPFGKKRDLAAALEGGRTGKKVMSQQMYKIMQEIANHDRLALEVEWVGALAVPFGSIPGGGQMKAFFAVLLEFREGKIIWQRNYDCFEAW
jgi:ketosteroid isomerase-like protein